MKSPARAKNAMGMSVHQMLYVTLFLAVVAVILGGLGTKAYYDIAHNPDEDQEVGNLTVNGDFLSKTGLVAASNIDTTAKTAVFTAAYNTVYMMGDPAASQVIALPAPRVGASIKFIQTGDITNGRTRTYGTTATDPDFAIGSNTTATSATVIGASSVPHHGQVAVGAHGFNVINHVGLSQGGGGVGSIIELTGVNENGTARWFVEALFLGQGTGAAADSSAMA